MTQVDALAAALREEILTGARAPGSRLVERELTERHGLSRPTVRAAVGRLAAEGLVRIENHKGARVAGLDAAGLRALFELRTAIEVEAARLALERDPDGLRSRLVADVAALGRARGWVAIAAAHGALHSGIVAVARAPRLAEAHAALAGELRVFMVHLRPAWSRERMVEHHEDLRDRLPAEGPEALRRHLQDGEVAVLAVLAGGEP